MSHRAGLIAISAGRRTRSRSCEGFRGKGTPGNAARVGEG